MQSSDTEIENTVSQEENDEMGDDSSDTENGLFS